MYERETERLQKMIEESESIVFFGGAGVSTESGIRILEVRMGFIIRSIVFHLNRL